MNPAAKVRKFLFRAGSYMEKNSIETNVCPAPPKELHIELTYRCDSSCIMCNLKELRAAQEKADITFREIKETVENSENLSNLNYIVLSGGEPWYNRDFTSIAIYFLRKFPSARVLILSNLVKTRQFFSDLEKIKSEAGLERVSLGTSIDGIGDEHDKIRGRKGAFESTIASAALIKKRYPQIFPCFNFTLLPQNAGTLFSVYRWAAGRGFNVSYQAAVPKKETGLIKWSEEQKKELDRNIDRIIKDIWKGMGWDEFKPSLLFSNLKLFFFLLNLNYISRYIKEPARYFKNCPCGERYAMINPEGYLYFCPVHKSLVAGNIREKSFDSIWKGKEAEKIRSFFNRKECRCWLSCTNSSMMEENFFNLKNKLENKYL